jgi:hypothetical protein
MASNMRAYAGILIALISATEKRFVPSAFLTAFYERAVECQTSFTSRQRLTYQEQHKPAIRVLTPTPGAVEGCSVSSAHDSDTSVSYL